MGPDVVAALAATGKLGLDYRDRRVWTRDPRIQRPPLAWHLPPRVRGLPMLGVTKDATSNAFIPQTAAECTTFFGNLGWNNPAHLYLWQEASGNILDKIGSSDLTASGVSYANAVTGWSTKAVNWANGGSNVRCKSTAIVDVSTTSALVIAYIATPTTPAATRGYLTLGTTSNNAKLTMTTTPRYRTDSLANTDTDAATIPTTVQCHVLKLDHTNSLVRGYVTAAGKIMAPTFSASMTGNELCFGSVDNGTVLCIAMSVLWAAVWTGSNAEKGDSDIKNAMVSLGNGLWTPTWAVSYARGPSETLSAPTDSVARAFAGSRAIAETDPTVSDLVARRVVQARALSESISAPTDAVARVFSGSRAAAESVPTVTDQVARSLVQSRSIAETAPTPTDSPSRMFAAARAVTESAPAPTDDVARAFAGARSIADAVPAPTDAVSHATTLTRAIGEAVSAPGDVVSRVFAGARAPLESIPLPADSPSRTFSGSRSLAESTPAPTDAVSARRVVGRTINESTPVPTDSPSRIYGGVRSPLEQVQGPVDSWQHKQTSTVGTAMICDEGAASPIGNEGAAAPISNEGAASVVSDEGAASPIGNEGAAAPIADEGEANDKC